MNSFATNTSSRMKHKIRGFTLIEMLIVVAIVGILAAVAYPSYNTSIRKSRRADAVAALTKVQQAQERWRSNNPAYAANAVLTTAYPGGLGIPSTTEKGYYTIAISGDSAVAYTVTATAVAGTSQVKDTGCTALAIAMANGTITSTPTACWGK